MMIFCSFRICLCQKGESHLNQAQLETFRMISKHKSYSKAAEVLHITQPTVTSRIKSLEKGLDCKLFKRIGHDISLTKQGLMFVEYAENILTYMRSEEHTSELQSRGHLVCRLL